MAPLYQPEFGRAELAGTGWADGRPVSIEISSATDGSVSLAGLDIDDILASGLVGPVPDAQSGACQVPGVARRDTFTVIVPDGAVLLDVLANDQPEVQTQIESVTQPKWGAVTITEVGGVDQVLYAPDPYRDRGTARFDYALPGGSTAWVKVKLRR